MPLEIFKTIGASELTGQDIDIAHLVPSGSDFGPKPIICKFVRRLAKENVINHRREVAGKYFSLYSGLQIRNFFGASKDL